MGELKEELARIVSKVAKATKKNRKELEIEALEGPADFARNYAKHLTKEEVALLVDPEPPPERVADPRSS